MIQRVLTEGYLFLAAGALAILAMLIRFILSFGYGYYVRASNAMEKENAKSLERLKKRFETMHQMNIRVRNVDIFVDKYMNMRKACGLYLSTWEGISGQIRVLCAAAAIAGGLIGMYYESGMIDILSTIGIGIGGIAATILVDNFAGLTQKKERLKINLTDYFENYLQVRLELSAEGTEHAASSFDKIYDGMEDDTYHSYIDRKLEKAEARYLEKKIKLEKKEQKRQKKQEEKAVFLKVKQERSQAAIEAKTQREQEALAEMRRRRQEKQKERRERILEEIRQKETQDQAEAMTAAAEEKETVSDRKIPSAEENKILEEVLKEFLV